MLNSGNKVCIYYYKFTKVEIANYDASNWSWQQILIRELQNTGTWELSDQELESFYVELLVKKDCPNYIGGQYLFIPPLKNNSKS